MLIRFASLADIPEIHQLANHIWHDTYSDFLTINQIEFMLDQMYSFASLKAQFDEGITFIVVQVNNSPVGFASYSLAENEKLLFKIHKLYLSKSEQGKGIGKQLISFIKSDVLSKGGKLLQLNVNRKNPTFSFYKKVGFDIAYEIDIPYHGYILNDYVMQMPL